MPTYNAPKFLKVERESGAVDFINVNNIQLIKSRGHGTYDLCYSIPGSPVMTTVLVSQAELSNSYWTLEQISNYIDK